tara:strand:- start:325 stop:786 length:462 start_codon:yes stop_codon:yes gene_type:complete
MGSATLYLTLALMNRHAEQPGAKRWLEASGLQQLVQRTQWPHYYAKPQVGAHYTRAVGLPVLGQQRFSFTIISRTTARITLAGAMNLDEPASYSVDESGKVLFELNEPTRRLLRRYRTRLRSIQYDAAGDHTTITICAPLIPPIRVRLDRTRR